MSMFSDFGQSIGGGTPGRENDRDGKLRKMNLSDGNTANLKATNPYGFWIIEYEKGRTPDDLKAQHFTSPDQAAKFLTTWLSVNRYNTVVVEEPFVAPELPVKKHKRTSDG